MTPSLSVQPSTARHVWTPPVELMLLTVAALWGGSYTAAKLATQHLPVLEFLLLRFGLTFVLLLPSLGALRHADGRAALTAGGVLGANLLAIFLCETYGVSLTTASNAAFLISLCVVVTPFFEWWLLGQPPSRRLLTAAGLSVLGAALLSRAGATGGASWQGDGLMLLAAGLRGFMVCLTRRLGRHQALPALTLTALQTGSMSLGLGAVLWCTQGRLMGALPAAPAFWGAMAFLVLLCTLLAFWVQNHAASRTSPGRVALLMGSEPLFGALAGVLVMGETLGPWGWLGGALMVASAGWATRPPPLSAPACPAGRPARG